MIYRIADTVHLEAAASAQRLHQTRLRSEDEARSSRPTQNRLVASSLLELLEERKHVSTQKEIAELAKQYSIDLEKLERLARHVNSVSVNQDTVKRWIGQDGAENVTMIVSLPVSVASVDEILASTAGLLGKPKDREGEASVRFRSLNFGCPREIRAHEVTMSLYYDSNVRRISM